MCAYLYAFDRGIQERSHLVLPYSPDQLSDTGNHIHVLVVYKHTLYFRDCVAML